MIESRTCGLVSLVLAVALSVGATLAHLPPAQGPAASLAALVDGGHFKRARAILEPRLRATPNDAEAAYLMSAVKAAYQDNDAALQLAQKAVDLDGKNAKYHERLAEAYGLLAARAGMFKQVSLARHFRDEAALARSLDPKFVDPRVALLEYYLSAPGILGGSKDEAKKMAAEISAIDPSQGWMAQARLAQENKDVRGEEQADRKAVAADPHNYDAVVALANFRADKEKNYAEAERAARAGIQIDATRADAWVALITIYAAQSRWPELDAALAQSEARIPDNLAPHYTAARVILTQGSDAKRAESYLRKYLTQEPEGGAPPLAAAHWRLGQALEKQGRKPEAISELETALKLQPDFPQAKQDLRRLK